MAEHASLDWYKAQADRLAAQVFATIKELGDLLLKASKDLQHEEYEDLEEYLLTTWTRADLRAARAVAKGELHPDLFPAGVRNSKVLSLSELDQRRLLGEEQFEVWGNDNRARSKTWREMSPDERNRLLGRKGGRIHTLDDQPRPGGKGVARVVIYERAGFRDGKLSLNGIKQRGEIQAGALRATMPPDELAEFLRVLRA
ncbi:MAG TPA: hypothetical protein VMV92_26235 [Streptosporangiaceae bacterium]|nr:hypothetical protein [Streptosporangiaceae bacterium]